MNPDFIKKLLEDIPPELRQEAFRQQVREQIEAQGGLDRKATAVATAAIDILQRLPAVKRSLEEIREAMDIDIPTGDAVFIGALFAAGMAYASGFMDMAPETKEQKKLTPEQYKLARFVTVERANNVAFQVYATVQETVEKIHRGEVTAPLTELGPKTTLFRKERKK